MGNVSDFFAGGGDSLPGGMTKDPRLLPCIDGTSGTRLYQDSTQRQPDAAEFWTELGNVGAVATSSSDDTYTTICDISGAGKLFHVVSQTITNTTDDVTFRITVDGVEYVIAKTTTWGSAGADNKRIVLGEADGANSAGIRYTTNTAWIHDFSDGNVAYIVPPRVVQAQSGLYVRFDTSLKVEVKVTDVYVAGTYGQYCGATYILD